MNMKKPSDEKWCQKGLILIFLTVKLTDKVADKLHRISKILKLSCLGRFFPRRFRHSADCKFSSVTPQRYRSRVMSDLPLLEFIRYLIYIEMQKKLKNKNNKKKTLSTTTQQKQQQNIALSVNGTLHLQSLKFYVMICSHLPLTFFVNFISHQNNQWLFNASKSLLLR